MDTKTLLEAAKVAPPPAIGTLTLMGYPLPEWVMLGSFLYTLFLLIDKFPVVIERFVSLYRWVKNRRKHE